MASTKSSKASTLKKTTSSAKGKKKAPSAVGAPSQHGQSSRKGKRAWRKNVNIDDVEEVLEGRRAEERVVGATLNQMQDTQLFQIDTKGDDQIRTTLPRYSAAQLTSTKILAMRSAVPAVFSRSTPSSNKRKPGAVTKEEKDRLLRIAKRPRKGPFNSVMDPSEYTAGSGVVDLSEAVKQSGSYDAWAPVPEEEELPDGLETVQKKKPKAPALTKTRDLIEIPAIVEPHQGTSYNPPADAHEELMVHAAAIEQKRLEAAEKMAETKTKIQNAKANRVPEDMTVAPGMKVQDLQSQEEEDEDTEEQEETLQSAKKVPERKTKVQKSRAARLLKEKRALAEKADRKRLLASINDAKAMRRSNTRIMTLQEKEREQRLQALDQKLKKQGLAGQKLGKHKVPEGDVVVQLGEDLSESLRELKPEGNLFRDRFQSLQQRALIEPRVPVVPTKRKHRIIEYEKHAWKNFDRD